MLFFPSSLSLFPSPFGLPLTLHSPGSNVGQALLSHQLEENTGLRFKFQETKQNFVVLGG